LSEDAVHRCFAYRARLNGLEFKRPPATTLVSISYPVKQLDEASHADEAKETCETKQSFPAGNKAEAAKKT
jgi:hypothetical protein